MKQKPKILIIGAGIGGLALAALLKKRGIIAEIAEQTKKWKTIGYVIAILPDGFRILKKLGLEKKAKMSSRLMSSYKIYDGAGALVMDVDFKDIEKRVGPAIELERDRLHRLLRVAAAGLPVMMGTRVSALKENPGGVGVTFSDGKKNKYDLVVGADGLDSFTRSYVIKKSKKDFAGFSYFFTWVENTVMKVPETPVVYFGDAKTVAILPSRSRKHCAVFFTLPARHHTAKTPEQSIRFIKNHFRDMGGPIPEILKNLPAHPEGMFHHDDEEVHLRRWFRGRVVLLGDAAHALSPILGMGGSMALEDGYVLAEEIRRNRDNLDAALKNYEKRRKSRVRTLARQSKILHRLMGIGRPFTQMRNLVGKYVVEPFFLRFFEYIVSRKI